MSLVGANDHFHSSSVSTDGNENRRQKMLIIIGLTAALQSSKWKCNL